MVGLRELAYLLESSGPVKVKKTDEQLAAEWAAAAEARRERARAQAEAIELEYRRTQARTSDKEWARIRRDEQRRADMKAAKKLRKKGHL